MGPLQGEFIDSTSTRGAQIIYSFRNQFKGGHIKSENKQICTVHISLLIQIYQGDKESTWDSSSLRARQALGLVKPWGSQAAVHTVPNIILAQIVPQNNACSSLLFAKPIQTNIYIETLVKRHDIFLGARFLEYVLRVSNSPHLLSSLFVPAISTICLTILCSFCLHFMEITYNLFGANILLFLIFFRTIMQNHMSSASSLLNL